MAKVIGTLQRISEPWTDVPAEHPSHRPSENKPSYNTQTDG
jgi:hypothetical protein